MGENDNEKLVCVSERDVLNLSKVKEGDLVRILTIDEIRQKYAGVYSTFNRYKISDINCYCRSAVIDKEEGTAKILYYEEEGEKLTFFSTFDSYRKSEEEEIAGKLGYITDVYSSGRCGISFLETDRTDFYCPNINTLMIEVVEENYMGRKKKEWANAQNESMKNINEELIQEMISKVDVRKMKRILSASLQLNAKQIKGIPELLREWANAKKDLYLLFDKQLRITTSKEYEVDDIEKIGMLRAIRDKFPRRNVFN